MYRAHIHRDVFASDPITTGESLRQNSVAVDEIQSQTVYLHLAGHGQQLVFRPFEVLAHAIVPGTQFLEGEHIIEAHHLGGVPHRREVVRECATYPMGR